MNDDSITLAFGAGGRKMHRLVRELFLRALRNPALARLEDAARLRLGPARLAFTTDAYVVEPLFFPGGDIGELAVWGTTNDLAVMGAQPLWVSAAFIIREGFPRVVLERVVQSMARAARRAGVAVVTGDTKVVERGARDELLVTTAGIGRVATGTALGAEQLRVGDLVYASGPLGDHEVAVLAARGAFDIHTSVKSDCACVWPLARALLGTGAVRMMRDPTRGGLATTLNEIASAAHLGIVVDETALPFRAPVRAVCNLLGLDPLYLASEGRVIFVADRRGARRVAAALTRSPLGRGGRAIGEVVAKPRGVWLRTRIGSLRPLLMLEGVQVPRIC